MKSCYMCTNAYTDPRLTHDNDLSYFQIGDCAKNIRTLFASGNQRPTQIIIEQWNKTQHYWDLIGTYTPKFCPNCGRKLLENKEK